jgi:hypothetical protein
MVRIFAVIQLCFVFITLCFVGGYPFMGELFELRTRMFIARTALGDPDLLQYVSENKREWSEKTLAENRELSREKQGELRREIDAIQAKMEGSFWEKLRRGASLLLFELPLLKRTWLFMALALSLCLLLSVEGATRASWVLPLLSLAYFFFSYVEPGAADPVAALYPREESLPAGESLQARWEEYVKDTWGSEFHFNLALLDAYRRRPREFGDHPWIALTFFAWNLLFAYTVDFGGKNAKTARQPTLDRSRHPA